MMKWCYSRSFDFWGLPQGPSFVVAQTTVGADFTCSLIGLNGPTIDPHLVLIMGIYSTCEWEINWSGTPMLWVHMWLETFDAYNPLPPWFLVNTRRYLSDRHGMLEHIRDAVDVRNSLSRWHCVGRWHLVNLSKLFRCAHLSDASIHSSNSPVNGEWVAKRPTITFIFTICSARVCVGWNEGGISECRQW